MQPAGEFLHPKRARVLAAIAQAPDSPKGLAKKFGDKAEAMDYHLQTLSRTGWARYSGDEGVDPADRVYRLVGGAAVSHASSASASLDEEGKGEVAKTIEQAAKKIEKAEQNTAKRCGKSGKKPGKTTIAFFSFEPPNSRPKPNTSG